MNATRFLLAGLTLAALALLATAAAVAWQCRPVFEMPPATGTPAAPAPAAPAASAPTEPRQLFGVTWQPSLGAAVHLAQATESGKPIVLLRVLGKLDDKL
jgi:hypothetical protein